MKQKLFLTLALLMTVCSFGMAQSKQAYAVYTVGDGTISNPNTLTFYYDDQKSSRPGTKYDLNTGNNEPGWYTDHKSDIQKAEIDESFKNARPTSTVYWFSCYKLTELIGLHYLNTSEVTDMSYMFCGCKLSTLNLIYFDTSKVTNMEYMFSSCSKLINVNVSSFDTSKVTNMTRMFNWCTELTYLNLASFNTNKISGLGFVDMFFYCSKLQTIYVSSDWRDIGCSMFQECNQLVGGEGTHYEERKWGSKFARVDGGDSKPGYFTQIPSGYAVFEGDSLTFYNDGKMSMKEGEKYLLNVAVDIPVWCREKGIEKVVFDKSFASARPISTYNWFGGFSILAEIKGWQYLNTSEVTTMNGMFSGCSRITNLDLSHFNTSKVTDMTAMFNSCISLKEINLLSFDTSNVTTMGVMFSRCNSLETINLGSFNTKKVTEMQLMFSSCGKLKTICVGDNWSVDNVVDGCWAMFAGCNNLEGEKGTKCDGGWDYHKEFAHIDGGEDDPGYLSTAPLIEAYAVYNDGTLTFYYDDQRSSWTGTTYGMNDIGSYPGWYSEHRNDIKKVVFNSSFQNARPVSTSYWFAGDVDDEWNYTSQITTITDIQYLNTSNVVDMSCMFHFCSQLKTIDVTGFKTDNVTNMYSMFDGCESLTTLDVSKFKTDKVTNMIRMFCGCIYLEELDVSNWNTEKVTYMNSLFSYCSSLTTLDVSNWNTANVEDMGWTFEGCQKLTALDVSNWKTNNVTDMSGMFFECYQLETLDVSNWNTAKVTEMYAMFENTSNLTSLDLSSFDTRNVTNMSYMFSLDKKLTTIYVGNLWSVSNLSSTDTGYSENGWENMFDSCYKLVGGAGTKYNDSHTGKEYAHIDGIGGPGYLTAAPSLAIATSLNQFTSDKSQVTSDEWYTIDGRKLNGMPAKKGIYIHNGKKGVVH